MDFLSTETLDINFKLGHDYCNHINIPIITCVLGPRIKADKLFELCDGVCCFLTKGPVMIESTNNNFCSLL